MKKGFVLVALILIVEEFGFTFAAPPPRSNTENASTNKLEAFLYERCRIYSVHAAAYDEVKERFEQFVDYFQNSFAQIHSNDGKMQFCRKDRLILKQAMGVIASEMKPCFPKDERYLPIFLNASFASFTDFLCADNGQNIDNFFSTQSRECLQQVQNNQGEGEIAHCFNKIFVPLNGLVQKNELCDDLTTAHKCFTMVLSKYCQNSLAMQTLNTKFFKAVGRPCHVQTSDGGSSNLTACSILILIAYLHLRILS